MVDQNRMDLARKSYRLHVYFFVYGGTNWVTFIYNNAYLQAIYLFILSHDLFTNANSYRHSESRGNCLGVGQSYPDNG
jgi:hypothetical protein